MRTTLTLSLATAGFAFVVALIARWTTVQVDRALADLSITLPPVF